MVASSSRGIGEDDGPADLSLCRPFPGHYSSGEPPCRHNEDVGIIVIVPISAQSRRAAHLRDYQLGAVVSRQPRRAPSAAPPVDLARSHRSEWTYWYFSASPELLTLAAERLEASVDS